MTPLVLLPGRLSPEAKGVREAAIASGRRYSEAIARAGGIALTVPPLESTLAHIKSLVERADAVLLHGGGDLDPTLYDQQTTTETVYGIVAEHDALELAIVRAAIAIDKPILAICRGIQVLNVALGGTLHQNLLDTVADSESHWNIYHSVDLVEGSRVAKAMGTLQPSGGHSYHHQSIDRVAADLQIVAKSDDGVIEAVEHRTATWVVGVQWHPEDDAATDEQQQGLFNALIAAARR
ncbi:MAG: gamma-glutamyl-gamma-aminobutyrate hydrolase family protein [Ilumatobacteraceae bacterium]